MRTEDPNIRADILKAAGEKFAQSGYAGTSVQDIVDATRFSKPALYYHFGSKAGIYKALVDFAYDECFRLMQDAIKSGGSIKDQLVDVLTALFEFTRERRDLSRIAFATAFAAEGEIPTGLDHMAKGQRNFELILAIVGQAQKSGELTKNFEAIELAYGIYGALTFHLMADVLEPRADASRESAERIVRLFMKGAAG